MAKRHNDALIIQSSACNPIAICKSLHEAMAEARNEDDARGAATRGSIAVTHDSAVRLMMHRLCHFMMMAVADGIPSTRDIYWERGGFVWERCYAECILAADDKTIERLALNEMRDQIMHQRYIALNTLPRDSTEGALSN